MPTADFANWVQPSEVADLLLWLADDMAARVKGVEIPAYGRDA